MVRDFLEVRLESASFPCAHLQIHRLTGREAISQLFEFELEVVSTVADEPTAAAMSSAAATIIFHHDQIEVRRIHGMIVEVDEMLETEVETRVYRLRFVPRAFRSTLIETQEIYLDLTVPEIIKQKLDLVGLGAEDLEFRLLATYPKLEFVVQYKESDLAFISRLAEHVGLSFFFVHDEERDKMVFTDHKDGFARVPGHDTARFQPRGEKNDVYHLEGKTRLIPSSYVMQDYNYRLPALDITASVESAMGFAGGVVEHGAHYKTPEAGKALAQIRAEEREATRYVYTGKSEMCWFDAGVRFKLEGHARLEKDDLLIVEVNHKIVQAVSMHGGANDERYANSFTAIDAALTYRPPRITPKPRIHGLLTGVVEQAPETDITNYAVLDEHGRYTIRFLFDTAPMGDHKASRPVRMMQPHVGPDYGTHFPLKPGIEVLLGFVNGDPDRPLIVGAVPNPETPSPVRRKNSLMNRIKTVSGILIEMKDL
jgi:type VI secretion system secreted protein VgrG